MRGTGSCRTTSASLPSKRRIWQQANAEPIASPSGRACEVSTNRVRCSMCWSTSFSMCSNPPVARLTGVSFLGPVQKFINAGFILLRTIQDEEQLGRAAQVQTLDQLAAHISARGAQSLHRLLGLRVIS